MSMIGNAVAHVKRLEAENAELRAELDAYRVLGSVDELQTLTQARPLIERLADALTELHRLNGDSKQRGYWCACGKAHHLGGPADYRDRVGWRKRAVVAHIEHVRTVIENIVAPVGAVGSSVRDTPAQNSEGECSCEHRRRGGGALPETHAAVCAYRSAGQVKP